MHCFAYAYKSVFVYYSQYLGGKMLTKVVQDNNFFEGVCAV